MSRPGKIKIVAWAGIIGLILVALAAALWIRRFHNYTPADALKDYRAAKQAEHTERPVERYLDFRYGPQTDAANRRKAFVDFFNVGHIEGLYLIVGNRTDPHTRRLVDATAQIFAGYRQAMTPEDKQALKDYFNSDAGRGQIQQATAAYLAKDVHFRTVTAPVIQELMTTLATVQNP
jgi:hypothetical protein